MCNKQSSLIAKIGNEEKKVYRIVPYFFTNRCSFFFGWHTLLVQCRISGVEQSSAEQMEISKTYAEGQSWICACIHKVIS